VNVPPLPLSVRTVTSLRLPLGPFFNLIVTGPEAAPDQVTVTGLPTSTVAGGNEVNINCAAVEATIRAAASKVLEKCMIGNKYRC